MLHLLWNPPPSLRGVDGCEHGFGPPMTAGMDE